MKQKYDEPRWRAVVVAALAVAVLASEVVAQSGWFLVAPPPARDKTALFKAVAATSEAETRAVIDSVPDAEQIRFIDKVEQILRISTSIGRMEALMDAAQDADAPLPKWRQIGAFDSAAICERGRASVLQQYEREFAKLRPSHAVTKSSVARA